jgi:hypothetical protein
MGGESDIRLAADDSGSHGSRTGHSDALAMPDMNLAQAGSDILGGSVPGMQSPSSTGLMGSMSKPSVQPHDTGIHQSGSDSASAMDDDDLLLAPEGGGSVIEEVSLSDVDLDLAGAASDSSLTASPSDKSAPSGGSGVDDELSLDGDFVLADERPKGKSGVGSDVSLGGDSGINLLPSDGGLSLEEEPLDLGGSAVDSLELPGDDQFVSLEEEADPDQATQLKADDQFMLSPSDAIGEEESDSGSQVIALEESESFDNDAATMLRGQAGMGAPLVADEMFAQPGMMAPGMMAGAAMAAGMAPGYAPQPVEAPYTIWQVVFLMALTGVMGLSAILIADVMQNMWTWQENGTAATFVMDNVIGMFGLDK